MTTRNQTQEKSEQQPTRQDQQSQPGQRSEQGQQGQQSQEAGTQVTARRDAQSERGRGAVTARRQQAPFAPGFYGGGYGSPFAMMRRMMDDMDRLFDHFGIPSAGRALAPFGGLGGDLFPREEMGQALWSPQVEMFERGDELVVRADLPGLTKNDVDVEVENGALVIRGERRNEMEDRREGYYRSERSYGSFYRTVPLPEGADAEQAKASFRDGVLEVTLPKPKREERRGRKVEIRG